MSLLSCQQLAVDRAGCVLIEAVDFGLEPGEVLHILGANGCGKSTLLLQLAGLQQPLAGRLLLAGQPLASLPARQLALQRQLLPQQQQIPFALLVADYLAMSWSACGFAGGSWLQRPEVAECCAALDIGHLLEREIHQLSGGEWQRVRLTASACLLDKRLNPAACLWLLDEPFAALDLRHKRDLLLLIRQRAAAGIALALVHHEPALAFAHADRVLLLGARRQLAWAQPAAVLTRSHLQQAFGVGAEVAQVGQQDVLITDLDLPFSALAQGQGPASC